MTRRTRTVASGHTEDPPATTTLRALQVAALLSVLSLLWQFVSAGQLFPEGGPEQLHAVGAVGVHVLTGATMLAAAAHWRTTHGPAAPTVLATVVFVLSFVQASVGARSTLWIHVPGALVLTIGVVWVAAWSVSPAARR